MSGRSIEFYPATVEELEGLKDKLIYFAFEQFKPWLEEGRPLRIVVSVDAKPLDMIEADLEKIQRLLKRAEVRKAKQEP